eukprot:SAG31_NODE_2962_length_4846_cov_3.429956_3_plen_239_part_00
MLSVQPRVRWAALGPHERQHLIHKFELHCPPERHLLNPDDSEYLTGLLASTPWKSPPPAKDMPFHGMEPALEFRRWRTDSPVQRMLDALIDEQLGPVDKLSPTQLADYTEQCMRRAVEREETQAAESPAFAKHYLKRMLQRTITRLTRPSPPKPHAEYNRRGLNFGGAFYARRLAAKVAAANSPATSRPTSPLPLKPYPPGRKPTAAARFNTAREQHRRNHFVSVGRSDDTGVATARV